MPLEQIDLSEPELFRSDTVWPLLRAAAPRGPGPLSQGRPARAVLVGHQVQRHHGGRHQPRGVLVGVQRWAASRSSDAPPQMRRPMFIAMDPPKHDEQRKTVSPIVAPANLATLEPTDPRARRRDPRQPAARRDLRLGRQGLDRADHADAGDAVRLPVRGPPLLTCWSDVATGDPDGNGPVDSLGAARWPSWASAWPTSPGCGTSASTREPRQRPDLDAGARRRPRATWRRWSSSAT